MYATLSKMFNWLLEKRRIKASPMANLKRPAPLPDRDRVLTDGEIIAFWRATDDMPKPFAAVLKLLLLTGCRREEVAGMEVKELSGDGLVWTIPSRRTKNRRVHVVPLPPLARAVIADAEQLPDCAYIFSTNQRTPISGFSKVKKRLDSQMRERLLTSSPRLVNSCEQHGTSSDTVATSRSAAHGRDRNGRAWYSTTHHRALPEPRQRTQGRHRRRLQSVGKHAAEARSPGTVGGSHRWLGRRSTKRRGG